MYSQISLAYHRTYPSFFYSPASYLRAVSGVLWRQVVSHDIIIEPCSRTRRRRRGICGDVLQRRRAKHGPGRLYRHRRNGNGYRRFLPRVGPNGFVYVADSSNHRVQKFAIANAQTTWHVDDDNACPGTGSLVNPFCSIQPGINAAVSGDKVLVAPGTYFETINFSGKSIHLRSSDGVVPAFSEIRSRQVPLPPQTPTQRRESLKRSGHGASCVLVFKVSTIGPVGRLCQSLMQQTECKTSPTSG